MLIAVIGGKLQGVEAVYLAKKAGWKTLVIDKDTEAPASGLCDRFIKFTFSKNTPYPADCPKIDLILPAIEDIEVLAAVQIWAEKKQIPLAFDLDAYRLSQSKFKSDTFFHRMNLPAPKPWPDCSYPVIAKPDQASGSQGVAVFQDEYEFLSRFPDRKIPESMVIQEFMEGPSYSVEVVGFQGHYQAIQVTDLYMDSIYDCMRVTAPTRLTPDLEKIFKEMSCDIASEIGLSGIMDVEVLLHNNTLKLLEIDARLPSQTPMTVFWSCGINMVEMLGNMMTGNRDKCVKQTTPYCVSIEHIQVNGSGIKMLGEHIMAQYGPLSCLPDFFGAREAITNYAPDKNEWVATLIFTGHSHEEIAEIREVCYHRISNIK